MDFSIVVPTLNAAPFAPHLLEGLRAQGIDLQRVLIIDSSSDDGTPAIFEAAGCQVKSILRASFDHGETRNLGLRWAAKSEVIIYLTQDAIPTGTDMLAKLLSSFQNPLVAVVYGRQVARDGAAGIEIHARDFNYPETSAERRLPEASTLGIKAIFNSNSFSAYRRSALLDIGGFPKRIIMGEDQAAVAMLLKAGWTIAYQADACVKHSHGYTLRQEFSRYFDIGVFHEQQRDLLSAFGTAGAEGQRYVKSELRYLLRTAPFRIPEAVLRSVMKLMGYKLGRSYLRLPLAANRLLAMNKSFFRMPVSETPPAEDWPSSTAPGGHG